MSVSQMVVLGEGDLAGLMPNEIQAEAGTRARHLQSCKFWKVAFTLSIVLEIGF